MPEEQAEDLDLAAIEVDDFEAAFNEHAESRESPDDGVDEEALADDSLGDPDDPNDPEISEPAEEEVDPYAGMTPEVKEKFLALEGDRNRLQHQVDSDKGRVTAFQRKTQALQNEIESIRTGSTAGRTQPTSADIAEAMRGSDDDWDQFSTDYPEIARAIDKRFEATGQKTAEIIDRTIKPVAERQALADAEAAETANQERSEAVAEVFPTWTEAVATDEFGAWLGSQTPGTQGLAASDDPRDATELISKYDAYLVEQGEPSLRATPDDNLTEPDVDANPDDTTQGAEPTELERRRQQQLEDGVASPSRRAGIDADADPGDDFEAAFNVFADRKEAQRA